MEGSNGRVRIVSRRMVRPSRSSPSDLETIHLTPWDLRVITVDYIQKGILLPKPPPGGELHYVDSIVSSFAHALGRFYPLAGRLVVSENGGADVSGSPPSFTVSLCCNDEGAEFVHAVAPDITAAVAIAASLHIPRVVWSFFPLNGLLGTDAAVHSHAVLAAQVTELADGVFIAMSLNHGVGDGNTFWHFFNTWSDISRSAYNTGHKISTLPPVLDRWFLDSCPVPIPLPFGKLEHIVLRHEYQPVKECFFPFSAESIKKLKAKASAQMADKATATISSLQSLLAHLWRSVSRARGLTPEQGTSCLVLISCRQRVRGIPQAYMGNAVELGVAKSTVGDILDKGLGWTAWLINQTVASFDEAAMRSSLASWCKEPKFLHAGESINPASVVISSSPRFNMYGNDFGWGRPVMVRSGPGNKIDGKVTMYEGADRAGSMAMEVCLSPEAMDKLVADEEFMEAVTLSKA